MEEFILKADSIELVKLIKFLGLAETGGHAKQMIGQGLILVNGKVEYRKRAKLKNSDEIVISGRKIRISSPEK